jgi:hypothetical protein
MQSMYYIGMDVHKRTISYCVKDGSGAIHSEGEIPATRFDLDHWMKALPQPWTAAMECHGFYRVDINDPCAGRERLRPGMRRYRDDFSQRPNPALNSFFPAYQEADVVMSSTLRLIGS